METFLYIFQKLVYKWMPDRIYLKMVYFLKFGESLHLKKPVTFNEKLNWLKLYNRVPAYSIMVDKYEVKRWVAEKIGDKYVVDNYGVFNSWAEIDFNKLPSQFVMKCTHDSGGAFVCRNKVDFGFKECQKAIEHNLSINFYRWLREWPYKNIKPRIIIDRYLDDHSGKVLRDYKFWCFNGKPMYMYCTIKAKDVYENFYDMDFEPVYIDHGFPRHHPEFVKPVAFELMKKLAAKLSSGIPFVRVDFFEIEGQVYFGEFTFFDWGGMLPFGGEWDMKLGELIKLPDFKQ